MTFGVAACNGDARGGAVTPATMSRVGTVDDRYQSYNVEMLEVTGGEFWAPYGPGARSRTQPDGAPAAGLERRHAGRNGNGGRR
jgi:hypothetical protein